METVDGLTTCCEIYNKTVQVLESKSVRGTVGQHWKDWVCQVNTRLAYARDLAKDRVLTRAEVTFYCKKDLPSGTFMEGTWKRIAEYWCLCNLTLGSKLPVDVIKICDRSKI